MHRTTIFLTDEQYLELYETAHKKRVSMAQLIRDKVFGTEEVRPVSTPSKKNGNDGLCPHGSIPNLCKFYSCRQS